MQLFFNAEHIGPPVAGTFHVNIRSAASTDGINFKLEPSVWAMSNDLADPVIYRGSAGRWLLCGFRQAGGIDCASSDSSDFTQATFGAAAGNAQVPGILEYSGGYRLYYLGDAGIRSAVSPDGVAWVAEAGVRVAPTGGDIVLVADPAPARRKDGRVVLYLKVVGKPTANPSPYDHRLYRATSTDGINFNFENEQLVAHASVPQAYTDANGRVWIYFLDFTNFPQQRENIAVTYERDDLTLSPPTAIRFDTLPPDSWANDPTPVLRP